MEDQFDFSKLTLDGLRTMAPTDYNVWPATLQKMGWSISHVNENPEDGEMLFVIEDDSGNEIPVYMTLFTWMLGDTEDTMAMEFFGNIEKLSKDYGHDILVLKKRPEIHSIEYEDKRIMEFSACARFYADGKWTEIYMNNGTPISSLYKQARSESDIPDPSLEDKGGSMAISISEANAKLMENMM